MNNNKIFAWLKYGKLVVTILVAVIIGYEFSKINWFEAKVKWELSWLFLLVFVLVFLNWYFEAVKWATLNTVLYPITVKDAFLAVIKAITWGLVTPGRVGEPVARIVNHASNSKSSVAFLTIQSSLSQFIMTALGGAFGSWFLYANHFIINSSVFNFKFILFISLLTLISAVGLYFGLNKIGKSLQLLIEKLLNFSFSELVSISSNVLLKILILSAVRYAIFIVQMYIVFTVFSIEIEPIVFISKIGVLYIAVAVLSFFIVTEVGLREYFAVLLFSESGIDQPSVAMAVFVLWGFNICLPALLGGYWINKSKSSKG